jgi:transcriptional regulator with XRE-family HTH domain
MKAPSVRVIANADRIAELCARRGVTLTEFCKSGGMCQATRSRIRNRRPIRVSTLRRIASKLGVSYGGVLLGVTTLRDEPGGEASGVIAAVGG